MVTAEMMSFYFLDESVTNPCRHFWSWTSGDHRGKCGSVCVSTHHFNSLLRRGGRIGFSDFRSNPYKTFYNSRPKLAEMKLGPDTNRNKRNMDDVKKKWYWRQFLTSHLILRCLPGSEPVLKEEAFSPSPPLPPSVQKWDPDFPCRVRLSGPSRTL